MRKGFTLVEILIVMAILALLMIAMVGVLNPIVIIEKSNDGKRKRDVARIRIALEDYYNDKHCYPTKEMLDTLMQVDKCGRDVSNILPGIGPWQCDPSSRLPYYVVVPNDACPKQYKIMAKLYNIKDPNIPYNWDEAKYSFLGFPGNLVGANLVNYGTSSGGTLWNEIITDQCGIYLEENRFTVGSGCYIRTGRGCNSPDSRQCNGSNCYRDSNCSDVCHVPSCGAF